MKKITTLPREKKSIPHDKYFLKDLHEEIALYDRKLAHIENYSEFATESEREEAKAKLITKRAALENTARKLAAQGVEFSEADLPRSFKEDSVRERRAS